MVELDGGKVADISFPDPNDLTRISVNITPDEGLWRGQSYLFDIQVPDQYPIKPPECVCRRKIYHPNINWEGRVCLNILREDWKPVLDINAVIYGLIFLFHEPNANDPLNHDAAEELRDDPDAFRRHVAESLRGRTITVKGKRHSFD